MIKRRKPDRRRNKETKKRKFNLAIETIIQSVKGRKVEYKAASGDVLRIHPKAFATKQKVRGAEHIGKLVLTDKNKNETVQHWHVDRRDKPAAL